MPHLTSFLAKNQLTHRLEMINQGNETEREYLIKDYIPFIIKTVSNTTNRYVESENSEEYSIGLEAFNEAINKYVLSKGSFINFAAIVIKSRVTDYLRKQERRNAEILGSMPEDVLYSQAEQNYQTENIADSISLKAEINELEIRLKAFGITFCDLVKESPKHKDTRANALTIAGAIFSDKPIKNEIINKKRLPVTKLSKKLNVSEKFLNRHKIFIIAAVLILDSDLNDLKEYIYVEKGGARSDS